MESQCQNGSHFASLLRGWRSECNHNSLYILPLNWSQVAPNLKRTQGTIEIANYIYICIYVVHRAMYFHRMYSGCHLPASCHKQTKNCRPHLLRLWAAAARIHTAMVAAPAVTSRSGGLATGDTTPDTTPNSPPPATTPYTEHTRGYLHGYNGTWPSANVSLTPMLSGMNNEWWARGERWAELWGWGAWLVCPGPQEDTHTSNTTVSNITYYMCLIVLNQIVRILQNQAEDSENRCVIIFLRIQQWSIRQLLIVFRAYIRDCLLVWLRTSYIWGERSLFYDLLTDRQINGLGYALLEHNPSHWSHVRTSVIAHTQQEAHC